MSRLPDTSHSDHDGDLRARFAEQRRGDHTDAPAWRDEWLRQPAAVGLRGPHHPMMRWLSLPLALGAACVALMWGSFSLPPEPRLSEALPPLFDETRGELFAGLGPSASSSFTVLESPSDFLLPDGLQSNLNLLNLP